MYTAIKAKKAKLCDEFEDFKQQKEAKVSNKENIITIDEISKKASSVQMIDEREELPQSVNNPHSNSQTSKNTLFNQSIASEGKKGVPVQRMEVNSLTKNFTDLTFMKPQAEVKSAAGKFQTATPAPHSAQKPLDHEIHPFSSGPASRPQPSPQPPASPLRHPSAIKQSSVIQAFTSPSINRTPMFAVFNESSLAKAVQSAISKVSSLMKWNNKDKDQEAHKLRNSTAFKPEINAEKNKLGSLITNPLHERLKNSERIRQSFLAIQEQLNEEYKNEPIMYPGTKFDHGDGKFIIPVEEQFSGFKPRPTELSNEGKAFYGCLRHLQPNQEDHSKLPPMIAEREPPCVLNEIEYQQSSSNLFDHYFIADNSKPDIEPQVAELSKTALDTTKECRSLSAQKEVVDCRVPVVFQSEPGYEISDVDDSDQDLCIDGEWREDEEDDFGFTRSYSNSATRAILQNKVNEFKKDQPKGKYLDRNLFNKQYSMNLSQFEFDGLVKLTTPRKLTANKPRKRYFINNKKVPTWAEDMNEIGAQVISQNTFGRHKQIFGKMKPITMLDVSQFFRPEVLKNYRRYYILILERMMNDSRLLNLNLYRRSMKTFIR